MLTHKGYTVPVIVPKELSLKKPVQVGLTLLTCLLISGTALACPEKDLSLEDESLGVIYADDLDTGEEQTVFSGACFTLGGLDLSAPTITVRGQDFESGVLTVSGDGISGTVQQLSGNAEQRTLTGVRLTLVLPSQTLSDLPLPEGTYLLEGEATQQDNRWTFARAILTRQGGLPERYELQGAVLENGKLTARAARLMQDLNQLQAEGVSGTPEQVQAETVEFCVCRDLDARELLVRAEDLDLQKNVFSVQNVQFYAYGLLTPSLGSLVLPLDPEQPLLVGVQNAFTEYRARLDRKPIMVVSDENGVALRNVPISLDLYTRLNLGVHALQQTGYEVWLDHETPELRVQAGIPASQGQQLAFPAVLVDVAPTSGLAFRTHFRTGSQETREFGVGYSFKTPDLSLLALVSVAHENNQSAPVYALEGHHQKTLQQNGFTAQTDTHLRLQYTFGDVAFVHDGFYRLAYQQGPLELSVKHTLAGVLGEAHFSAFSLEQRNQTEIQAAFRPEQWSLSYGLTQNWLKSQTRQQLTFGTSFMELEGRTRYDALAEDWLNLSLSTTLFVPVTESFRAEPMLGYDFAQQKVLYGFGGTFYTPNYAYTLGAYQQAEGWGVKARIGLR